METLMTTGKMHAGEVDTDASLVKRLLAAQFPRWADLPVHRVASTGTVNAMYRLGDDMVVRLPRLGRYAGDVDREHRWLPRLAPHLPVAIPVPLARGAPGEGYPFPWSVYRWLAGENPTAGRLADPSSLAGDLAEFVIAMRRIGRADAPPASFRGPLAAHDAGVRAAIRESCGLLDAAAVTAAWEAALRVPEWSGPPVWVHADLMPGNLLVAAGRLVAVIDFSAAGVGDPACDLMVAWNLLPAGARDDFRAAVRVDEATWARGRGLALLKALQALPYYRHTNPAFADNAYYVIRAVLADRERGTPPG
jgi:aminoglycoside phosphotransferase (APT) family kinase protein